MYIHVRVLADAKKERVENVGENRWRVDVTEPAKQNLANRRVVELLAAQYHTTPGRIKIVSGHRSPSKILSLQD